jgi:hypothetical protein
VQEFGPRPYQDYPIGDWPYIKRQRHGGVPQIKRIIKYGGAIVKVGRALNKYEDAIRIIDYTVEHWKQTGKQRLVYDAKGWTKCNSLSACTIPPEAVHFTTNTTCIAFSTACLDAQYGTYYALGTIPNAATSLVVFAGPLLSFDRRAWVQMYVRGVGTPAGSTPLYRGTFVRLAETVKVTVTETEDAFALPIGQPASVPEALPWALIPNRQHNRNRDPNEQYQRGYGTTLDVRSRDPDLQPDIQTFPDTLVVEVPVVGSPVVRPPDTVRPHSATRPRKREKEAKLIAQATGALKTVLNVATEAKDVVDALYKALPRRLRPYKKMRPHEKAVLLYKHFGEIDKPKALKFLIENQAEDKLFGKIGKMQAKANRRISKSYGIRFQAGLGPAL